MMELYKENIEAIVKTFNSNVSEGLGESAVLASRAKYGNNVLKATNSRSIFKILFNQFKSPLVIILIVASIVSYYLGQPRDGTILLVIVVLNSLIGFYQEWKSENILASLKKLIVNKCTVIRQGKTIEIFAEDLVPGDIVKLYEGDGVPADIRLIHTNGFSANEFILTGESLPSDKDHLFTTDKSIPFVEIKNAVYKQVKK